MRTKLSVEQVAPIHCIGEIRKKQNPGPGMPSGLLEMFRKITSDIWNIENVMSATATLASRKWKGLLKKKRVIRNSIKYVIPNLLDIDIVAACSSALDGGLDSF